MNFRESLLDYHHISSVPNELILVFQHNFLYIFHPKHVNIQFIFMPLHTPVHCIAGAQYCTIISRIVYYFRHAPAVSSQNSLDFQKFPFFLKTSLIAGESAVFSDDAVAGNDDGHGILPHRLSHGLSRSASDPMRQLTV